MSILDWFNKNKTSPTSRPSRLDIPGDLWLKCPTCRDTVYLKDLEQNNKVCPCEKNHHFRVSPEERINMHFDTDSFHEIEPKIESIDFLKFEDTSLILN